MIRLIRFNLFSFASRLTTYVIPLITLVVVSLTAIIFSIIPGSNFINKDLTLPILFFFSMVFLIQSTIIFFRLPQEETLLPIMMTKPYSKRKLYFSQLISNELVIITFSIYIASLFTIIGAIDGNVSGNDLGLFFASALVGNIVIMTIFASLISLTCLITTASWNTLIWMMIVFIIPISSFIASGTLNKKFTAARTYDYNIVMGSSNGQYEESSAIYLDVRQHENDMQSLSWNQSNDNPYATFAWFDPWYQLSDLYSLFRNKEVDWDKAKWNESTTSLENSLKIDLNNVATGEHTSYNILVSNDEQIRSRDAQTFELWKTGDQFKQLLRDNSQEISSLPFERQLYFFRLLLNIGEQSLDSINFGKQLDLAGQHGIHTVMTSINSTSLETYMYFTSNNIIPIATTTDVDWNMADNGSVWVDGQHTDKVSSNILLINEDSIKSFTPSKFVDTKWVILIWSILLFGTLGGGILIYTRKEISQA